MGLSIKTLVWDYIILSWCLQNVANDVFCSWMTYEQRGQISRAYFIHWTFPEPDYNVHLSFFRNSLKASLKHITYFEGISFGSASWKKGASPWVIKYANFVEPRHNFPTILLSGSIIFSKSTMFWDELYEKWLSLTFKAHNISAFRTLSLRT